MISQAETVDEYLALLPPDERAVFGKVRALFKKASPQVAESMQYKMPTYLFGTEHFGGLTGKKIIFACISFPPPLTRTASN